jgi:excisionase family DNA binding protein
MKPRFSGLDDGSLRDSTPAPSQCGASAVAVKRARAKRATPPARRTTAAFGSAHPLSDGEQANGSTDVKYYTVEEIADLLNVSSRTVRRWVRSKLVESYKFGASRRIGSSGLQALIARCRDI